MTFYALVPSVTALKWIVVTKGQSVLRVYWEPKFKYVPVELEVL